MLLRAVEAYRAFPNSIRCSVVCASAYRRLSL